MRNSSPRARRAAPARWSVTKHSATLIAVGAGLAAGAEAEAAPIVTTLSPAVTIADSSYSVDLNNDLVFDLAISHSTGDAHVYGDILGDGILKADRLDGGTLIGPESQTFGGFGILATPSGGQWPGQSGYLGLRFLIGPNQHYGWAELTVGTYPHVVTLSAYAYESDPGTAIRTPSTSVPEPHSLALLALGAAGLAAFRRRSA